MSENKLNYTMNAFAPTGEIKGRLDLQANIDSLSVIIDSTETGTLTAGTAVKIVGGSTTIPHVVKATTGGLIHGFIKSSPAKNAFVAGDVVEISYAGDVMYLEADDAVTAGVSVNVTDFTDMAVKAATGSGSTVGWALESASAAGELIRVLLTVPVKHTANS